MRILNLTQHPATSEQKAQGVCEYPESREILQSLLTFEELPSPQEIERRAETIARIAIGFDAAMIGGAIFLMPVLTRKLKQLGIEPLAAFSQRVSIEQTLPDGSVRKTNIFKHLGFVPIP